MANRHDADRVPGVPETLLSPALLAALPAAVAPAPWTCVCDAVVWLGRGGGAATAALPPALRAGRRGLAVLGGFVCYRQTPVGAYDEVLGVVGAHTGYRPWGSVGFMAVNSRSSLAGGRANWGLPKTLAAFEGGIATGWVTARGVDGVRWRVGASYRAWGPALPLTIAGSARQQRADGRVMSSRLRGQGRVRPALVWVEVDSEGPLASWLRPGRHLGAVLHDVRFTLAAPLP